MTWKFDSNVASMFANHARKHIPDYDKVIRMSIDLCREQLQPNDAILEVGCAVGETVDSLHRFGFNNIHAVDNSQAMLDKCRPDIATYYCSSDYPKTEVQFSAIICNWTLHFMISKKSYLQKMYSNLKPGGFLILSDKTCNSGLSLSKYHDFKRNQGVSEQEIAEKAKSLIGVMHVDSPRWYLDTLNEIGFKEVAVANAAWCFTTFVAIK